jgi:probable rRNA maturation factor
MELFLVYDFWIMAKKADERIHFHYLTDSFFFPNRGGLKTFTTGLIRKEGQRLEHINYVFCSDAYLLEINQKYLHHNTYTDIITFELSPKGSPLLADIFISIDRVRENAKSFDVSFLNELHRVIFHGALHLCGFSDKTKKGKEQMRQKEGYYLSRYFVPRGTR